MRPDNKELLVVASKLAPTVSTWAELGREVNRALAIDISDATWRGIRKDLPLETGEIVEKLNRPIIEGVTPQEDAPPFDLVYQRLVSAYKHREEIERRKRVQRITLPEKPTAIAFIADIHFGSSGTDYERVFEEAEIVANTPGMYVVLVGDLVDNFILPKMLNLRMGTSSTITEEWVLVKEYLSLISDKLLGVVGGNHDWWTFKAAGVDLLHETLVDMNKTLLYDTDELYLTVEMGQWKWPTRLRHKWRWSSILNPTHGAERTYERDQSKPFVLGVGAHTHVSGLVREFNAGGQTGVMLQCGSYKRFDSFADQLGLPAANSSAATVAIFHPEYGLSGYSSLHLAVDVLTKMRK